MKLQIDSDESDNSQMSMTNELIHDFYIAEKQQYKSKIDEVLLFGPSKAEEAAKKQLVKEQRDAHIKELKALKEI